MTAAWPGLFEGSTVLLHVTCFFQVQLASHHSLVASFLSFGIAWVLPCRLSGVKARGAFALPAP